MFGKLNAEEIEQLISSQLIGRLGCHADNRTYVVPVSYAYDGEYIYTHTFEGMKIDMLRKNPSVCFQVDDTHDLANWRSVVCWGEFEELKDTEGKDLALKHLNARKFPLISSETMHLSSIWPFSESSEYAKGIFFRIRLTEKTGRFEKSKEEYFFAS